MPLVSSAPLLSLATALEAGVPLLRVLTTPAMADALPASFVTTLRGALDGGAPIGSALCAAGCVDESGAALLDAGAEGGFLPRALRQVAAMRDEAVARRRSAVSSLAYPVLLLGAGSVVQPLPTLVTDGAGAYARAALPGLAFVAGVLVLAFVVVPRLSPAVRAQAASMCAHVPVVGGVVVQGARAALCDVLGALVSAGVPMTRAVPLALRAGGLSSWSARVPTVSQRLASGSSLVDALHEAGALDRALRARLAIAEESGKLDEVLPRLAREARDQASASSKRITAGAGVFVFLVAAVMMGMSIVSGMTGYLQQIDAATAE